MVNDDFDTSGDAHELFIDLNSEDVEVTWFDRMFRAGDRYLYAPAAVAWSDWRSRTGILIILLFILMGTVGVHLIDTPMINETDPYLSPFQTWEYPLGADRSGEAIHKQLVHATPAMLQMAAAGVLFSVVVAVLIGTVAGYKGGVIDYVLMTITDIVMVIPGLPLIIVIAAIWQPRNPFIVGTILAVDAWPGLARMIRSQVLTIREEAYIEAQRAMGIRTRTIVLTDVTPQLMPYVTINAASAARGVIFASVSLYFLGFLPFSTSNWGVMMNFAYSHGGALANPQLAGYWLYVPMFTLILFSFGLILFSQGMDRVFNPRIRARHAKTVDEDEDTI